MKHFVISTLLGCAIAFSSVADAQDRRAMDDFAEVLDKKRTYNDIIMRKAFVEGGNVVIPVERKDGWGELTDSQLAKLGEETAGGLCVPEVARRLETGQFGVVFRFVRDKRTSYDWRLSPAECGRLLQNKFAGPSPVDAVPIPGREDLPLFEFKNVSAGQQFDFRTLGDCHGLSSARVRCSPGHVSVAGHSILVSYIFRHGMLSELDFDVTEYELRDVLSALNQRYGPPCEAEETVWRNRIGMEVPNPTFTWCFKTGDLIFKTRGKKIDRGEVTYVDTNTDKPSPPPIDF